MIRSTAENLTLSRPRGGRPVKHSIERSTNVLIIDDDPIVRALLAHVLESQSFEVAHAVDGESGLREARRLHPDLILLDVVLPGVDGFEVCRRLREQTSLAEVYVLMMTTNGERESRLKGFEAGADDFLAKPVDIIELKLRLRNVARLNRYRHLVEERERNMQLLGDLYMAYNATLEGWAQALDLRDRETEGHTQRVTQKTIRLARAMPVPIDEQEHMYRGALLHDIGKIGIPDAILHKPGKLTAEERKIMNRHPDLAYRMLSGIEFLRPALDIPYCHHERWDGTGYPRGLKGEEIPRAARIFAVVDVWDALRYDRPYRKAWPAAQVLAYIKEHSGTQFDPAVVEAFERSACAY